MDERVSAKDEEGGGVKEVSLELFLENLPLGVYFVVPDGRGVWRFTYVNKALADIAGYRPEELIGTNAIELISPEYREMVIKNAEKRFGGEEAPEEYVTVLIRKDGTRRVVSLKPLLVRKGKRRFLYGIVADLTDIERLNRIYRLFISALSKSNIGFLASEGDLIISRASEGAASILGWESAAEMKGLTFSKVFNIKEPRGKVFFTPTGDERLKGCLKGEGPLEMPQEPAFWRGEVVSLNKKSGEERRLLLEISAFPGLNEKLYMLVIFVDETPLLQALRRADAYLDIIVHDIANFMTPIYGYMDYIDLNFTLPERVERSLNKARMSIEKITRLLNSIRLLSAIPKIGIPSGSAEASEVIQAALEEAFLDPSLPEEAVHLDIEKATLPAAEVFSQAFQSVLSQVRADLPLNARDIMVKGKKREDHYIVHLEFPSERDLDSYYSLFLRRFDSLELDRRGTGLWFSLSRDLLKSVGGSLHLEKLSGKRVRVEVKYPLRLSPELRRMKGGEPIL